MIHHHRISFAILIGIAGLATLPLAEAQQPDPDSPRYKAVVALSDFLTSEGDEPLKQFIDDRVSPSLVDSMGRDRLTSDLAKLRADFTGAQFPERGQRGRTVLTSDFPTTSRSRLNLSLIRRIALCVSDRSVAKTLPSLHPPLRNHRKKAWPRWSNWMKN